MSATSRARRSDSLYHETDSGVTRRWLCDKVALLEDELHESQEELYGLHCMIAKEESCSTKLKKDNAKLQKELTAEHVLAETLGHYHELEQDENAKLRELVRILYYCKLPWKDCDKCAMNGAEMHVKISEVEFCDGMYDRMRELGIEVDG